MEEFWKLVHKLEMSGQSKGQAAYNACEQLWPNVARQLQGSSVDCYYHDEDVGIFVEKMKEIGHIDKYIC